MRLQDLKIGDYVVENKEFFVIMDIYTDTTGTYYDLKGVRTGECVKAIPRNKLRHATKLIPATKLSKKSIRILYG